MNTPLTPHQKLVITGFTGTVAVDNFSDFHADVEKRLGGPVFTHEMVTRAAEIKEAYRADFLAMCQPTH